MFRELRFREDGVFEKLDGWWKIGNGLGDRGRYYRGEDLWR